MKKQVNRIRNVELINNKNEVFQFNSVTEAGKWLNCNPAMISNVIAGRNKTVKGYTARGKGYDLQKKSITGDLKVGLDIDG